MYSDDQPLERKTWPGTNPRDAVKFWRGHVNKPLFVYFIQDERGPVKIGKASNPFARLSGLQVGNPFQLTLRAVILATPNAEQRIHEMWGVAHIRGEWFGGAFEPDIVARARLAQRRQIESILNGETTVDAAQGALSTLSLTGMRRG